MSCPRAVLSCFRGIRRTFVLVASLLLPSAGQVKILVFWDCQGIIFNYLDTEQNIPSSHYSALLDRLKTDLQEKCRRLSHIRHFPST